MSGTSRIWHPLTQHGLGRREITIERAQGAYLYAADGRKIFDAISSWWVVTHGHCHPKIVEAVQRQAEVMSQIIFADLTHEPAELLAEELLAIADPHLRHVFYSDSGSTAVEVAIKMAVGAQANSGRARHKIIALEGGYHGDTFGAMATGARGVFNAAYQPMLFDVIHVPLPDADNLDAFADLLRREGEQIAAFVFEPLVQGAGGMRMYDGAALKAMCDLCGRYGIYTIADEVMTGFGRTGTMFACEQAGISPDLMCLSKGLTGGFLPMGVTLASEAIYAAFYSAERGKMFMHSTSFTANPLACAAARASLAVWREEDVQGRVDRLAALQAEAARRFGGRALGTIMAVDFCDDADYLSERVSLIKQMALERGVLIRPLGGTVYVLPPYCSGQQDLQPVYEAIEEIL